MYEYSMERETYSKQQALVDGDQADCDGYLKEIEDIEAEVQRELDKVMPYLEETQQTLSTMGQGMESFANELKAQSTSKTPLIISLVLESVMLVLNEKTDLVSAKSVISQRNLIDRLLHLERDHLDDNQLKKLRLIVYKPEFNPEMIAQKSVMAKFLAEYVQNVE